MTTITSDKVSLNASPEEVFKFLEDFNNMDQLLPRDKISDWKSDFDSCSFKIQNPFDFSNQFYLAHLI